MKRTFLALSLALMLGTSVHAKTPKEVLEPYKAYRVALEADNEVLAAEKAHEAWQIAEKLMGDSKTTGDLASNYADLNTSELNGKRAYKEIAKAYERSIELGILTPEDGKDVQIQRWVDYLNWAAPIGNVIKISGGFKLKKLGEKIAEYGFEDTTYQAEFLALKAQDEYFNKRWKPAEVSAKEAMSKFASLDDNILSYLKYTVPIYLGRSLEEQQKYVEAAIVYQNLIDVIDQDAGHENSVSAATYGEWLGVRDKALEKQADDPRIEQIKAYRVPEGRTAELAPLVRVPPRFTSQLINKKRSAKVRIKFNVDINGRVINPVVTSSSDKDFHEAALKSLEDWRYTPNLPEAEGRNIETTIAFSIANSRGKILEFGEMKDRAP